MMGYLEKLEFSKDWTKAEDFPTYEPDESQVRADLQLLHNEAKAAINALVDKLESAEFASHLAVSAEGMTDKSGGGAGGDLGDGEGRAGRYDRGRNGDGSEAGRGAGAEDQQHRRDLFHERADGQ